MDKETGGEGGKMGRTSSFPSTKFVLYFFRFFYKTFTKSPYLCAFRPLRGRREARGGRRGGWLGTFPKAQTEGAPPSAHSGGGRRKFETNQGEILT